MHSVVVTNNNDITISDGYDGMSWDFLPNQKVTVPLDAAVFMFAYGVTDPVVIAAAYRRHGWNTTNGKQYMDNFDFALIQMVPQEVADEADALKIALEECQGKLDAVETELGNNVTALATANELLAKQTQEIADLQKQVASLTT
jgi:hypothetical protein